MGNKLHVMLVEDDQAFREVLKLHLEKSGYHVTEAADGMAARDLLFNESIGKVDCIVTDVKMPKLSGVALLRYIKEVLPDLPVILMTGFSDLIESKQALNLGAAGFLCKPFRKGDLDTLLNGVFPNPKTKDETQVKNEVVDQYQEINIDEFIVDKPIDFNIYVRVGKSRHIKIATSGHWLYPGLLRLYKSRGFNHLYIHKEDYSKYCSGFKVVHTKRRKAQAAV